jgi:hypothetical protein
MKPLAGKHRTLSEPARRQSAWPFHCPGAWFFACVVWLFCMNAWSDAFHIDSVRINAPKIANDSLVYTLDIHFHEHPAPFWSYYEEETGSLIVEFLDAQVVAPEVKVAKGLPFVGFKVRNMNSEMALTKLISRLTVTVDRGSKEDQFWNNDVRLVGTSMVRIIIWKEKAAPEKNIGQKKSRVIAISVGVSTLVAFAIIALIAL